LAGACSKIRARVFKVFPENPIIGDILDLRAMVKGTRSILMDQFLRSKSQGFRTKAN
jgi:hypothetical protein